MKIRFNFTWIKEKLGIKEETEPTQNDSWLYEEPSLFSSFRILKCIQWLLIGFFLFLLLRPLAYKATATALNITYVNGTAIISNSSFSSEAISGVNQTFLNAFPIVIIFLSIITFIVIWRPILWDI